MLSKRRQVVFDAVKSHISLNGYPPTIREIMIAVGLTSPCSVQRHLQELEQDGYISRVYNISRSIVILKEE